MKLRSGPFALLGLGVVGACTGDGPDTGPAASPVTYTQWFYNRVDFEPGGELEGFANIEMLQEIRDGEISGQLVLSEGWVTFNGVPMSPEWALTMEGQAWWTDKRLDEDSVGPCIEGEVYPPGARSYTATFLTCQGAIVLVSHTEEEGEQRWLISGDVDPFFAAP